MSQRPALALLAAGSASRFGGGKLDALLHGKPLARHALDTLLALSMGKPQVVVAPQPPAFAERAAAEGLAELVINSRAETGLGSSVACAAKHAEQAGADVLLLCLADMPLVSLSTLSALLEGAETGHPSATLHSGGKAGIPACFPRDWFPLLETLGGAEGAGSLLRQSAQTRLVRPESAELTDVDHKEDLTRLNGTQAP